jgi:hypothetical protein
MVRTRHPARSVILVAALSVAALAVAAGCAGGSGGAGANGPRRNLTATDYYPLARGWKWAYDLEKDGQKILAVYAVLERSGDTAIVQAGEDRLSYAITPDGIAQKEGGALGDYVIKNPVAVGTEWRVAGGTAKVVAFTNDVTVEAGHFNDCAVVEVTRSDPVRLARTTFAPDIGPISIEFQIQDGTRFVTSTRASLRSVTKPGEDLFSSGP